MIFKRGKQVSSGQEPQTKSSIFEPSDKKIAPASKSADAAAKTGGKMPEGEPPTRDAIFTDAPIKTTIEPPTGWAAIIAGPEKGKIIALGYGETPLKLSGISSTHSLNFDSELQTFSLLSEDGEKSLVSRETFKIGTHSLFIIPLCADGFDWRTS